MNEKDVKWSVDVGSDTISIENKLSTTKLFINDSYQDVFYGFIATIVRLSGVLPDGRNVKVVIGGDFNLHCTIFVENECVFED